MRRNAGIITIIGRVPNLDIRSQKNALTFRDIGIRLMALLPSRTSGYARGLTKRPTRIMASIRHQTQVSSQAQSSMNKRKSGWISGIALILPLCTYTVSFTSVERKSWDFWILRPTISE